ncbi:MAG: hypothetical protein R6U61_00580 [Thermoplasmata archaeon]
MSTTAFCPGHITGFFSLSEDHGNLEKIGSKGAGFSVDRGVTAKVDIEGSGWTIIVDGNETSFLTVEKAVSNFAAGGTIELKTDLPFSQGFGMSGACSLSSTVAVCHALDIPREKAVKAAHIAEVFCRTGLGDVIAQSKGGFERRIKPGVPPYGEIESEEIDREVVLAVVGLPLITPHVLSDPILSEWIKKIGNECIEEFSPKPSFENFLKISHKFAFETKFAKKSLKDALWETREFGEGSMSMIGNSVFMVGDTEKLKSTLEDMVGPDRVFVVNIDNKGTRILE